MGNNTPNLKTLTVLKCTEVKRKNPEEKKTFRLTLRWSAPPVVTQLGTVDGGQETYYLTVDKPAEVGMVVVDFDLSPFRIVIEEFILPDGPDAGKIVELKHLYPKQKV